MCHFLKAAMGQNEVGFNIHNFLKACDLAISRVIKLEVKSNVQCSFDHAI